MEQEKKKLNLKIIIILLAIVILAVIGIVVFTGKDKETSGGIQTKELTKDKMQDVATTLNIENLVNECYNNINRANDKYLNNIYSYTATITEIRDNYIIMNNDTINNNSETMNRNVIVYLSKDEIKELNKGQTVKIIGKISKLYSASKTKIQSALSTNQNPVLEITIKNAYVVNE